MELNAMKAWALSSLLSGLSFSAYAQDVTYIHTDALGSVIATSDESGNLTELRDYEPYGYQLEGFSGGVGYTGHVQDSATGLVYMQQRYYDPLLGRFLSVDPVGALSDPIVAFGRYHYANNNPYKYVDPDGRFGVLGFAVGAGLELVFQGVDTYRTGENQFSVTRVAVAGGVGAVTGGVGGALGRQAAGRAISTTSASVQTAVVGGATAAGGEVTASLIEGENISGEAVVRAGVAGFSGAGVGTRIALQPTARAARMASAPVNSPAGVGSTIMETTTEATGRVVVEGGTGLQRTAIGVTELGAAAAGREHPRGELR